LIKRKRRDFWQQTKRVNTKRRSCKGGRSTSWGKKNTSRTGQQNCYPKGGGGSRLEKLERGNRDEQKSGHPRGLVSGSSGGEKTVVGRELINSKTTS